MKALPNLPVTADDDHLFVQGWKQEIHDFTNGYPTPNRLIDYLLTQGYKPAEENGLLFSGCGNVNFHSDDVPSHMSVVWCLSVRYGYEPPTLIVGSKTTMLQQDSVIVFDPTKQHAVMAEANHPYLLYVLNVRKVKHDSKN